MKLHRKSQYSLEYMVILGLTLLLLLPSLLIVQTYIGLSAERLSQQQALQIARKLVDAAEAVESLGAPTRTTLKLNFPDNIEQVVVLEHTLLFVMRTGGGLSDISASTDVTLTGSLPQGSGLYEISIEALSDGRVELGVVT